VVEQGYGEDSQRLSGTGGPQAGSFSGRKRTNIGAVGAPADRRAGYVRCYVSECGGRSGASWCEGGGLPRPPDRRVWLAARPRIEGRRLSNARGPKVTEEPARREPADRRAGYVRFQRSEVVRRVSLPRDRGQKGGVCCAPAVRAGPKGQPADRLRTERQGLSEASGPEWTEGSARRQTADGK